MLLGIGCAPEQPVIPENAIVIGAILPFSGKEAALGKNLEQALMLAVRDVNEAGGIEGRPLALVTRDSNSGSDRGFEQLLELLYTDQVDYLIGPEETDLATTIVPDVKGLDVVNLLPGYAAPSIEQTGNRGAWIKLAPSTGQLGCAMARHVYRDGATTVNALTTLDDYNSALTTDFFSNFGTLTGESLPSVSAQVGASSYVRQLGQVFDYGADRTLMMAPAASASTITTEWTIGGRRGAWYLSPLLHADVFLQNIPFGTLNGTQGLSPSLSLESECAPTDDPDVLDCSHANAERFSAHFASYWHGDAPFPAANYYYDSVVLLALGLASGYADRGEILKGRALRDYIRALGDEDASPVSWHDLKGPLTEIKLGTPVRYVGAGAEYKFDKYGAAQFSIFDTWIINNDSFVDTGTLTAVCKHTI